MSKQNQPPLYRRFLKPLPILSTAALLLFAGWFVFGEAGMWDSHKLRRQKRAQAEKIRELEQQKERLADYLADLRAASPAALERAARERGLVAPNETIYNIKVEEPPKK